MHGYLIKRMCDSICLCISLSINLSVSLSERWMKRHQMCQTSCRQSETHALLNLQDSCVLADTYNHISKRWLMIIVNWLNSAGMHKCFRAASAPWSCRLLSSLPLEAAGNGWTECYSCWFKGEPLYRAGVAERCKQRLMKPLLGTHFCFSQH